MFNLENQGEEGEGHFLLLRRLTENDLSRNRGGQDIDPRSQISLRQQSLQIGRSGRKLAVYHRVYQCRVIKNPQG